MSDLGPDPYLVRLLADAAPEDRERLARVFGESDLISRHLPAYAVAPAIRACWLMVCAMHANMTGDPWAPVLDDAARRALVEAAGPMEILVTRAPTDARELDR